MDQDTTWYGGRPRPRSHCARWGPSSLSPKKGPGPQRLAHVCCGKTAGWIKMPLGTKIDLGPRRIVLHGDSVPPPNKGTAPIFGPYLLWPNGRPSQLLLSTGCVLASLGLLHRRRWTEVNQTLHDVWPSPLLEYPFTFSEALAPYRNFARCKIHFASKSCVVLYLQRYCTALEQCQPNFAAWYNEWNYGTFAPSHFRCRERKPLTEFGQLENSLQMEKLKQTRLTTSL